MKTKHISLKFLLLSLLAFFYSCESFVDIYPPTTVNQNRYFKTEADIKTALNGAYGTLRNYYGSYYILTEIPSDNTEVNARTNSGQGAFDRLSWIPTTSLLSTYWNLSYATISSTNIILEKIEGIQMDTSLKERMIGEAKFIRALMYFNLVRFFGEVPIILTEIETEEQAYSYRRESIEKVYSQIILDLLAASDALPSKYPSEDIGRATKGAANALLGKVYLTNKKYDEAIVKLKEVIDGGEYQLLPKYADIFNPSNGNNEEIVFAIQYAKTGNQEGSNFAFSFAPTGATDLVGTSGSPASANQGTLDLFDAFDPNDSRKEISIKMYPDASKPHYTSKFLEQPTANNEGEADWLLIRYSDVLLMYSEALNEVGRTTDAYEPLNQVRARANLESIDGTIRSDLRLVIENERRLELCFEGHRWFDLIRTDRMVPVMTSYKNKYKDTGYEVNGYQIDKYKSVYPIPFRETNLNPELLQNPGY